MKKVTMKDIAARAGVSTTTVSKILNHVDMHISEATREKVWGLVRQYNYVPNEIAKGLRRESSNMIGVMTYDITDPYVSKIVMGIESACKAHGISVLIGNTSTEKTSEADTLRFLSSKMVDGIICLRSLSAKSAKLVPQLKIPLVVVDYEFPLDAPDVGIVDSSSLSAAHMATRLLAGRGCRAVSYIGPAPHTRSSCRIEGYKSALKEAGIQPDEALVYQEGDFSADTGIRGVAQLFSPKAAIDGVVCANDRIAAGVLLALSERGISVPEEVKVTGIDNIAFSQYMIPPLTTVDLHGHEVGCECADMLIAKLKDDTPLGRKLIDCEIVMRKTV